MSLKAARFFPAALRADQRGVALIVVLWIFIFLFVVAFDFSSSVREEASAVHRYHDETEGYYLALAGFQKGLYDFLNVSLNPNQTAAKSAQPNQPPADLFDGSWHEGNLGTGAYRVRLMDEGGKINLNRIDENGLRRVLTNIDIGEPLRSILVDSILDWRDTDDLHRLNGAESDYYRSLTPPYTAKNGPFDTVDELLWVRGVTPSVFFGEAGDERSQGEGARRIGLREIFTVDSPIDRVNLRTASAEVIHAVTGIPLDKCRRFVEERKTLSEKTFTDLLPLLGVGASDAAMQSFVFTNPSVVAVEAEGQPAESRVPRRVKGTVRLGGGQQGYQLLRWIDRDVGLPSGQIMGYNRPIDETQSVCAPTKGEMPCHLFLPIG
jgi:general secretion pathway protein K